MKFFQTVLIVSVLFFMQLSVAQEQQKKLKNTVFVELGGNAQGGSFNFERQLTKKKGLMLALGIGFALAEEDSIEPDNGYDFGFGGPSNGELSVPASLTYLFDINNENYIEVGVGYTWINFDKTFQKGERATHNFIAQVGFRRHFGKKKKWIWKANFSPIFAGNGDSGIEFGLSPMVGVAIGMRF